jgi:hypothetical protein
MIRHEMDNMVWALESTVTLADGQPRRGKEAAREIKLQRAAMPRLIPGDPNPPKWNHVQA